MLHHISYKKISVSLIIAGAIFGGFWYARASDMFSSEKAPSGDVVASGEALPAPEFVSQLDGSPVSSTSAVVPSVIGIMIDNHPDARPPSGLSKARVVYEALAEGGITRFMAMYAVSDQVEKVGPVRSARPYFMDWFREYGDGPYVHCGGSPQALEEIKQFGMFDADQFFNGGYFWRDYSQEAPHNLYINTKRWTSLIEDKGKKHGATLWQGWLFGGVSAASSSTVSSISLTYTRNYVVSWKYNATTNQYQRFINSVPHKDASGEQMTADTIVIEEMSTRVLDEVGRKEMETVGNGPVRVLRDGIVIRGTWKKASSTDRTRFYGASGEEIPLKAGKIWLQIIPPETQIEVTN